MSHLLFPLVIVIITIAFALYLNNANQKTLKAAQKFMVAQNYYNNITDTLRNELSTNEWDAFYEKYNNFNDYWILQNNNGNPVIDGPFSLAQLKTDSSEQNCINRIQFQAAQNVTGIFAIITLECENTTLQESYFFNK